MNVNEIIIEIDRQIVKLQQARALLAEQTAKRGPGRPSKSIPQTSTKTIPAKTSKKRTLSPEARRKIADAQKARWAKTKRANSK